MFLNFFRLTELVLYRHRGVICADSHFFHCVSCFCNRAAEFAHMFLYVNDSLCHFAGNSHHTVEQSGHVILFVADFRHFRSVDPGHNIRRQTEENRYDQH